MALTHPKDRPATAGSSPPNVWAASLTSSLMDISSLIVRRGPITDDATKVMAEPQIGRLLAFYRGKKLVGNVSLRGLIPARCLRPFCLAAR
jgi:hypothetical protein